MNYENNSEIVKFAKVAKLIDETHFMLTKLSRSFENNFFKQKLNSLTNTLSAVELKNDSIKKKHKHSCKSAKKKINPSESLILLFPQPKNQVQYIYFKYHWLRS